MSDENVITIGNVAPNYGTTTLDISKFCTTGEDGVISININKEENETKIEEELNNLLLQEEKYFTGYNISRVQELLNKLPIEEKRIEMTYRKDVILKSLKIKSGIKDIENKISDENCITTVEDILSLIIKYMEINRINKKNDLSQIESNLIKLHKDRFEDLLSKENYSLVSINDNLVKNEDLRNQIERLQKNIKFVSNINIKNVIMEEVNLINNIKSKIESKLSELLNCGQSFLEKSLKSQKLMNTINHSSSSEEIDNAIIENNYADYINLGQKRRKKALATFMEKNNKKYTTIAEVNKDLDIIVGEVKKRSYDSDTIEF